MAESPSYTYRKAGTYTVSLTASNDAGSTTSTRTGFIRVLNPGETLPVTSTPALAETQSATANTSRPAATSSWKPVVSKTKKAAADPVLALLAAGIVIGGIAVLQKRRDP